MCTIRLAHHSSSHFPVCNTSLRLHSKSFEAHDPAFLVIDCHNVVLCPRALELHPEDLYGAVPGFLHRLHDLFVLAFEAGVLNLFYVGVSDE